jgi:glycosyltransferase involved in cell wall biosynthesis
MVGRGTIMADIGDLVSIIVPAYNAEKYIAGAISSVLQQTYSHFELIIVDDDSQDHTTKIVRTFNDKRIKLIKHASNQGPGGARNTAIEAARGRWMALLDADDQWQPDRLEKLIKILLDANDEFFVADDILLCFDTPSGLRPWGRKSRIHYNIPFDNGGKIDLKLLDIFKLKVFSIKPIIPLNHVQKFGLLYNENCLFGEDFEFICHLFRTGLKLRLISDPLYIYRITPGSLTSNPNRFEHLIGVYKRLIVHPDFSQEERALLGKMLNKIEADLDYNLFAYALKQRKFGEALFLAIKRPVVIIEFLYRFPYSLRYRLAAWRKGGQLR